MSCARTLILPLLCIMPVMAEDEAYTVSAERSIEGILLPWNSRGVWPYSPASGEAQTPETLLRDASAFEASGSHSSAYFMYRKILVQYPEYKGREILSEVYFGMARCLRRMNEEVKAANLILQLTARGALLYSDGDARAFLESSLTVLPEEEKKVKQEIRSRLKSWPERKERTAAAEAEPEDATPIIVSDDKVPPPGSDRTAEDLFKRVLYYCRKRQTESARVYYDYLAVKYPGSHFVLKARNALGEQASRRQ